MEKFWIASLKATGPTAVVGFILWGVVQQLFQEDMLSLFETGQRFTISIVVVSGLTICLIAAILSRENAVKKTTLPQSDNRRSAKLHNTTVEGDFVMGDKIEKDGKK